MRSNRIAIAVVSVSLIVCGMLACDETKPHTQKDNEASWCHYYKDKRTDICYAGDGTNSNGKNNDSHLNHDHSHLTAVPCNDAVERLLEPWPDYEN